MQFIPYYCNLRFCKTKMTRQLLFYQLSSPQLRRSKGKWALDYSTLPVRAELEVRTVEYNSSVSQAQDWLSWQLSLNLAQPKVFQFFGEFVYFWTFPGKIQSFLRKLF